MTALEKLMSFVGILFAVVLFILGYRVAGDGKFEMRDEE